MNYLFTKKVYDFLKYLTDDQNWSIMYDNTKERRPVGIIEWIGEENPYAEYDEMILIQRGKEFIKEIEEYLTHIR